MPLSIRDTGLNAAYQRLKAKIDQDPKATVSETEVIELIAELADSETNDATSSLVKLKAAVRNQAEVIKLASPGTTAEEREDFEQVLSSGGLRLDPAAYSLSRKFLLLSNSSTNGLQLLGSQANDIRGTTLPGSTIEAINLSRATLSQNIDVFQVVGQAGTDGAFSSNALSSSAGVGDLVQIRARHADGTVSTPLLTRIGGTGADTSTGPLSLQRIALKPLDNDTLKLLSYRTNRPIAEPFSLLQFTNQRTGAKTLVALDERGNFLPDTTLSGKSTDAFTVSSSDGTNNRDFRFTAGSIAAKRQPIQTVDLPDPELHPDELDADGKPLYEPLRYDGPLYTDGIEYIDPKQGRLGNCYFPSAIAAIAVQNASALSKIIRANDNGTYTVKFFQGYRQQEVTVDGDLYVRPEGRPLYGSSTQGERDTATLELWYPILEKAFAQLKGGYDNIGNGGVAGRVMESILGRSSTSFYVSPQRRDGVWTSLTKAFDQKRAVSAGTHDDESIYTNTGVYANHSYSVIGYKVVNGQRLVTLRNPWGSSEPTGNGANDGIFDLPLDTFCKLYQAVDYC